MTMVTSSECCCCLMISLGWHKKLPVFPTEAATFRADGRAPQ
jgi:hypothetical protein